MNPSTPPDDTVLNPFTEDDISNYLLQNPDFFQRHAELLASVQLSNPHHGRAVSLQERQAQMLREKIRSLEHKLVEVIRAAQETLAQQDKLNDWVQSLWLCTDDTRLPEVLVQGLVERYGISQGAIRLWDVRPEFAHLPFAQGGTDNVKALAASMPTPYCDVNKDLEPSGWFAQPALVRSMAMVPLRRDAQSPPVGLLVLGSDDGQRFHESMETQLLARLGELACAALIRLRLPV